MHPPSPHALDLATLAQAEQPSGWLAGFVARDYPKGYLLASHNSGKPSASKASRRRWMERFSQVIRRRNMGQAFSRIKRRGALMMPAPQAVLPAWPTDGHQAPN